MSNPAVDPSDPAWAPARGALSTDRGARGTLLRIRTAPETATKLAEDYWQAQALCLEDPLPFFEPDEPTHGDVLRVVEAKRICSLCPVRAHCLVAGHDEAFGIWGGTTPEDRGFPSLELLPDPRVVEVARLTRQGMSGSQIAARIGMTQRSVERFRATARELSLLDTKTTVSAGGYGGILLERIAQ